MNLGDLALDLILLLIPGMVSRQIFEKLVIKRDKKEWEDIFEILLNSIICYVLLSFFIAIPKLIKGNFEFIIVDNLKAIQNKDIKYDYLQIVYASIVGIPLAYVYALFYNKNVLIKLGAKLKVSNKHGEQDLWEKFQLDYGDNYMTVRDYKANVYYFGYIETYSDTGSKRELIMNEVSVYESDDGGFCYKLDKLYISRGYDDLTIELFNKDEMLQSEEEIENGEESRQTN